VIGSNSVYSHNFCFTFFRNFPGPKILNFGKVCIPQVKNFVAWLDMYIKMYAMSYVISSQITEIIREFDFNMEGRLSSV